MERVSSAFVGFFLATAVAACGSSDGTRQSFDPNQPSDDTIDNGTVDDGSSVPTTGDAPAPQAGKIGCAASQYSEPLPTSASLASLSYSPANAQKYLLDALDKRYPWGKTVLQGGLTGPLAQQQGNCFERFTQDRSSATAVLQQAETVVHECGHFYDLGKGSGSKSAYVIAQGVELT
jgi:hypothetical protein